MMTEQDAASLLKMFEDIGVDVWLDGGWGVDALLGYQTRSHNDLDIFIEKKNSKIFLKMLSDEGYSERKMEYTTANHTVWCDHHDRIIDLHLFEFRDAETLSFDNEVYPSYILNGRGIIGGIKVNCLTAQAQLLYHQGYDHDENDVHDVLLLCKKFDLPIPGEYENARNGNVTE